MNSGFSGADVAQLRLLSSKLKTQSGKLSEIALSSSTALLAAEWTGNDIDAIRGNWNRKSLPALRGLANSLHEMGVELDRQAMEQERASGATAGAPASSIFERLQRAVEGVMLGIVGILAPSVLPKASPEPSVAPPVPKSAAPTPKTETAPSSKTAGHAKFDQAQQQRDYDAWRNNGAAKKKAEGWCTSWVEYRRDTMVPPGSVPWGNGGKMATSASTPPSAGGIVSFPNYKSPTNWDPGHVAIVEEIKGSNPPEFVISEMNAGEGAVFDMNAKFGNGVVRYGRTIKWVEGTGWTDGNEVWPELHFLD